MMNGEVGICIEIEGIAPLLQHNGRSMFEDMKQKKTRKAGGTPGNSPDEWRSFLYPKIGNECGHPSRAIKSCLVSAGREFKADKRRSLKDTIRAMVFINDQWIALTADVLPRLKFVGF